MLAFMMLLALVIGFFIGREFPRKSALEQLRDDYQRIMSEPEEKKYPRVTW